MDMENLTNSLLLKNALKALYAVAERRTSEKFADETIGSAIKTLERKYDFLKHVRAKEEGVAVNDLGVYVSPAINNIDSTLVGKAFESIIRMVYTDLNAEAGLYFITELKQYAGDSVVSGIANCNVDLDQVQLEQHHLYRRRERKESAHNSNLDKTHMDKKPRKDVNFLGYSWNNVSSWKHEEGSQYCVLYGKNGDLHTDFDHERFAEVMKSCDHKWLITYDDCEMIRDLFNFANIKPWSLQYGMNNYKQDNAGVGNELFIANYSFNDSHNKEKMNTQLNFWTEL